MITCTLCPVACRLNEGEIGTCRVRQGDRSSKYGTTLLTYGSVSTALVGPIEQKPLFHFMPGANVLSIGSTGCNQSCGYCQNFEISQVGKKPGCELGPDDVIEMAISKGARGIAFTYSEPLVWYEYVRDVAIAARGAGLVTVLKTNAFCNEEAFVEIVHLMDAINIDVKGGPRLYKEVCGIEDRGEIMRNLGHARRTSHVEVSSILIPGYEDELGAMFDGIRAACGSLVPIHLLRFIPDFKMRNVPPTSFEAMASAQGMARKLFKHVYLGYSGATNVTRCDSCGEILVSRDGLAVTSSICDAYCPKCKAAHGMIVPCGMTFVARSAR